MAKDSRAAAGQGGETGVALFKPAPVLPAWRYWPVLEGIVRKDNAMKKLLPGFPNLGFDGQIH
jgi:hypothetical protein